VEIRNKEMKIIFWGAVITIAVLIFLDEIMGWI
jgi:hypothetical protein